MRLRQALIRTISRTAGIAILAFGVSSCGGSKNDHILRFIRVMDQKNVVHSPLIRLEDGFIPVKESVKATDLQSVTLDGHVYFVFSPAQPLLDLPDQPLPERAELHQGENILRYSDTPLADSGTWRWIKGARSLDWNDKSPSGFRDWVKLPIGGSLRASGFFPAGDVLFELQARSGDPQSYRPRLVVRIGSQTHDVKVGGPARLRFMGKTSLGVNEIQVAFPSADRIPGRPGPAQGECVLVRPIQVVSAVDLVLIAPAPSRNAPSGTYELTSIAAPSDRFLRLSQEVALDASLKRTLEFQVGGAASIELAGRSLSGPVRISLSVDSRECGSREVPEEGAFVRSFPVTASSGPHELKVVFSLPEGIPSEAGRRAGVFLDSLGWINPRKSFDLLLHQLHSSDLEESGILTNPWHILKKLKVRGTSWNAILAPPMTVLRFKTRVPDRGVLRFGYGLTGDADASEGDGVGFEVSVSTSGTKRTAFAASLDPHRQPSDRAIFFRDIDLTAESGKTVELLFVTHAARSRSGVEEQNADRRNDVAFWLNPILFSEAEEKGPEKKNIILISMDAARPDHLGCYGYGRDTSPALDQLAKESVLFRNAISQAPYTLASHMTMLTGVFPTTHHVLHMTDALGPSILTLAERLQAQGWLTAAFTGGGLMDARYGYARGFDEYHDRIIPQDVPDVAGPLWRTVSEWIERNKDLNFFMFLHTYQVHSPYRAPAPLGTMFLDTDAVWTRHSLEQFIGAGYIHKYAPLTEPQRRNVIALYDGGIRYLDENLTRPLLDELKRLGLYEKTLLIVTSDHGEEFFDHLTWGHSNTLYNELLKVALIMKFPGEKFRGVRPESKVRLVDIAPTVLDEMGIKVSRPALDGESLVPVVENKETKDRFCLSYLPDNIFADPMPSKISLIQGRYKIILNDKFPARAYIYFSPPPPDVAPVELFDLEQDPLEKHNLASEKGEIARRMLNQLQPYIQSAKRQELGQRTFMDKELEERLRALGYVK
jgi:arylsulfatase A-like enzyme